MSQTAEGPVTPALAALRVERAARKAADRKLNQVRDDLRAARDRAELWEYRAKRYRDERDRFHAELTRIAEMS